MSNSKQPSYLFVRGSRVVGRAFSLAEAIKLAKRHPDALICCPSAQRDRKMLVNAQKREAELSRAKINPVARYISDESSLVVEDIEKAVESSAIGASLDDCWHGGLMWEKNVMRAATNEECAHWEGAISLKFCVDLRRDLPSQLSRWLVRTTSKFPQMIKAIEQIDDIRNRRTIRRLVSEKDLISKMAAEGKCIGFEGKIVSQVQFDRELQERLAEQNVA